MFYLAMGNFKLKEQWTVIVFKYYFLFASFVVCLLLIKILHFEVIHGWCTRVNDIDWHFGQYSVLELVWQFWCGDGDRFEQWHHSVGSLNDKKYMIISGIKSMYRLIMNLVFCLVPHCWIKPYFRYIILLSVVSCPSILYDNTSVFTENKSLKL